MTRGIHRLREERRGALSLLVVAVVLLLVATIAVIAFAAASNPTRPKNDCGGDAVSYARSRGIYEVSAFLGDPHGEFTSISIDVTEIPSEGEGPDLSVATSWLGKQGRAHVEVTVTGPGGVSIADWKTKATEFDFPLSDQVSGGSRPGDFVDGLTCFKEHGGSNWQFSLIWVGSDGFTKTLDTEQRTVMV